MRASLRFRRFPLILLLIACACPAFPTARGDEAAAPPFYADKSKLLVYLDADGAEHPVANGEDWLRRRGHILANMQQVMGKLPRGDEIEPLALEVLETRPDADCVLKKITFAAGGEDRLPGILLIPNDRDGKLPAILCLHQTNKIGKDEPAGLGGSANLHYALELARRGYVTLAVDYPNFGEYKIDPYAQGYLSATMKGIYNHMRAVDLLQSLDEVDPERIGAIGHSLGGHNAMFVAAFDTRIKCVVSSCGFCSFRRYFDGNLAGWSHAGYMPRIRDVYELKAEKMPFDFTEVVAALAPRPFLAVAPLKDANFDVEGVRECISAAAAVYTHLDARERLAAEYPDCAHDFPPPAREIAYAWFDRWLKK